MNIYVLVCWSIIVDKQLNTSCYTVQIMINNKIPNHTLNLYEKKYLNYLVLSQNYNYCP